MLDPLHARTVRVEYGRPCDLKVDIDNCLKQHSAAPLIPTVLFQELASRPILWFLAVAVLQFVFSSESPTSGVFTVAALSTHLLLILVPEYLHESKQRRQVQEVNNRLVRIWNSKLSSFHAIPWAELRVGHIVLLQEEPVPADTFLLVTGHKKQSCLVQTSRLTGHSSLEQKTSIPEISKFLEAPTPELATANLKYFEGSAVTVRAAHQRIDEFTGFVKMPQVPKAQPIRGEHILLRGTKLKSAVWTLGLVLYTGKDTRLAQNTLRSRKKRVQLTTVAQTTLVLLIACAILLTGLSLVLGTQFTQTELSSVWITYIVYYHHLAPVQLLFTLQTIRLLQGQLIRWDRAFVHQERGANVHSVEQIDQLGLVEHVFTDKTGTLTTNNMKFRKCFVNNTVYGSLQTSDQCQLESHPQFSFYDPRLVFDLHTLRNQELKQFFKCICICHTAMGLQRNGDHFKYKARSPDEVALLTAAHCFGYSFLGMTEGVYFTKLDGKERGFKILGIHEFSSERRRMSVLVKHSSGAILYCKGADSVTLHRCEIPQDSEVQAIIDQFSQEGLRVMVMARRYLSHEETTEYLRKYTIAKNSLSNQKQLREELAEEYETGMQFLGVAGIEDTVQERVPEAVTQLLQAGVKVWMLTGDKLGNSIKTAYSSSLFQTSSKLLKLTSRNDLSRRLNHYLLKYVLHKSDSFEQINYDQPLKVSKENLCLVLTGEILEAIINNSELLKMFVLLCSCSQGLVCCQAQPIQKCSLVAIVKKYLAQKPVTLAIGDGQNDVLMLQEADIAVAVGNQDEVKQYCEFAVPQFQDLPRLVLLHGRNNYCHSSAALQYVLQKNWLFVLVVFGYGFYSGHSGSDAYSPQLLSLFAVWISTVPTLAIGATQPQNQPFRQSVPRKMLLWPVMKKLMGSASVETGLVFLVIHCLPTICSELGHALDGAVLQSAVGLHLIVSSSIALLFYSHSWTILFLSLVFLQLVVGILVHSLLISNAELVSFHVLATMPSIQLAVLLMTVSCLLLRLLSYYWSACVQVPSAAVLPEVDGFNKKASLHTYKNAVSSACDAQQFSQAQAFSDDTAVFSRAWASLLFHWSSVEAQFKGNLLRSYGLATQAVAWMCVVSVGIYIGFGLAAVQTDLSLGLRVAELSALLALCFLVHSKRTAPAHELAGLTLVTVATICGQIAELLESPTSWVSMLPLLQGIFTLLSVRFAFRVPLGMFLVIVTGMGVCYSASDTVMLGHCFISFALWLLLSICLTRVMETTFREEFVLTRQIPLRYKQFQDILGNLMPAFVKDRVNQGIRYIAEEKSMVTVMFCDIYNFEAICGSYSPDELIELLDTFFSLLDRLCDKHGVAKIETVGKTYMVCGGLDDVEARMSSSLTQFPAAERCLNMAMSIIAQLESVYLKNGEQFTVKIGVHSGPVIAGVVGSYKPQFSLVGDTVNTASRMCSTIKVPGQIQLSQSTYELIDSLHYTLIPSKVEAKGKGLLNTFYVQVPPSQRKNRHETLSHFYECTQEKNTSLRILRRVEALSTHIEETQETVAVPFLEFGCSEGLDQLLLRQKLFDRHRSLFVTAQRSAAVVYALLAVYVAYFEREQIGLLFLRGLCSVVFLSYTLCFEKLQASTVFSWLSVLVYMIVSIPLLIHLANMELPRAFCVELDLLLLILVVSHFSGLTFSFVLVFSFWIIVLWALSASHGAASTMHRFQLTASLLGCIAINLLNSYFREQQFRTMQELQLKADDELLTTNNLLAEMMPRHVLQSMKEGVLKADIQSEVSILYADISGFTSWASDQPPIEVIRMLSKLFCKFDQLCVKHQVYKVHTIGDCYVVLGMTDNGSRSPLTECLNVVAMALDMLKVISCLNRKHGTDFQMRIGIHTGTVIAGITGTNIVRYDIYGPDNDIANKTESAGAPGRVNVTADTMNFLMNHGVTHFVYQANRPVVFELTKRIIPTHFLFPS